MKILCQIIMIKKKRSIEVGLTVVNSSKRIVIDNKGPYLVYGSPLLKLETIKTDAESRSWYYEEGRSFNTDKQPTALCRCGASNNKPYCDGTHLKINWSSKLTATADMPKDGSEFIEGDRVTLQDTERFCAYARFCDAKGRVWRLIKQKNTPQVVSLIKQEVMNCPAGRLRLWDRLSNQPIEDSLPQSLSLIEDPEASCSGPLRVKGGIPIDSSDGVQYELRNRVTLCRCGASSNKPFCDGAHATINFKDNL